MSSKLAIEMNFDGLVGPTHNYAGLSHGNIASSEHKGKSANPRAAALQGLTKMRKLMSLGLPQALLPPQERPHVRGLRALGFAGTDAQVLGRAFRHSPALVGNYSSASSMWTANAATVTPSSDSEDGRVHFTPANLTAMPHRALEDAQTRRALSKIFAGAFHNDVVCVSNGPVLFFHEAAFADVAALEKALTKKSEALGFTPQLIMASAKDVPLEDVISSYLFNSQLVTLPSGGMALILPSQVEETPSTKAFVEKTLAGDNPITEAHYLDLRQSMANGGGPACLRLRVVLTPEQCAAVHPGVVMTRAKVDQLEEWVKTHYRDRVERADLGDAKFLDETREALDDLTKLLDLPELYDFQRTAS